MLLFECKIPIGFLAEYKKKEVIVTSFIAEISNIRKRKFFPKITKKNKEIISVNKNKHLKRQEVHNSNHISQTQT